MNFFVGHKSCLGIFSQDQFVPNGEEGPGQIQFKISDLKLIYISQYCEKKICSI